MTEHDRQLCEEVADLWQSRGGDADGLCYLWMKIHEILQKREQNAKSKESEVANDNQKPKFVKV